MVGYASSALVFVVACCMPALTPLQVADPAARRLPDTLRAVVVDNLTVAPSGGHSPFMSPVHPCLARAFSIMEPFFERHVIQEHGQHLLGLPERWEMVLDMLPTGVHVRLLCSCSLPAHCTPRSA